MIRIVLVCSTLLTTQGGEAGPARPDAKVEAAVAADQDQAEALAKYNALREKTPDTAAAQWKLGVWCEENGLKAEAIAHFSEVVRLDPKREAAWRKLGFKKSNGQWLTDEQIAEEKEQAKADRIWTPILKRVHRDIHGTHGVKKRDEAQAVLDAIRDPQAIGTLYREFAAGGERDQIIVVQTLGQIDQTVSTKVLALLAVYGKTPEVRRRATETLRGGRAPQDYLPLLVGLMKDPLKYEVKPVGGPGSPGILFVEGEKFNVRRFYAPPAPNLTPMPGDTIRYDDSGMPVIVRPLLPIAPKSSISGSKGLAYERDLSMLISPAQALIEAQRGALTAKAQLESDAALIDKVNDETKEFNELVMAVARDASGKDRGRTPKEWRDGLAEEKLYVKTPAKDPVKPTFSEMVPLAYNPVFGQLGFTSRVVLNH